MMTALTEIFGPYPFDKYGMTAVTPFQFGGMEHLTITTLHRAYKTNESIVLHELAHQWWGDLVTCGTWKDIWLNESFATYSEALWVEWVGGAEALKAEMTSKLGFQYGSWTGALYDPEGQGFDLFANSVYDKGAWVLHTLRGVLGDSLFFKTLEAYRDRYRQASAVTDDFRAVVDSVSGGSFSWFFDQWVYGSGWPEYAFQYRSASDSLEVTIYQMQKFCMADLYDAHPAAFAGGRAETPRYVVNNTTRTETFRIASPFSVVSVDFDPDGWILKKLVSAPLSVDPAEAPSSFRLLQNYPNPFNPGTVIRYELPAAQHVTLVVYDLLGREVVRLVDQEQDRGAHAIEFSGDGLAAGLYLYRIQTAPTGGEAQGGHSAARKMVLVK